MDVNILRFGAQPLGLCSNFVHKLIECIPGVCNRALFGHVIFMCASVRLKHRLLFRQNRWLTYECVGLEPRTVNIMLKSQLTLKFLVFFFAHIHILF